jgi:hypothetical protein
MGVGSGAIILEVHAASGSVDPQREAQGLVPSPEYNGSGQKKLSKTALLQAMDRAKIPVGTGFPK